MDFSMIQFEEGERVINYFIEDVISVRVLGSIETP